jgi:hypothetical protein
MKNRRLFHSAREAKEFLVLKIVEEGQSEGLPLSEIEQKMLYFSETHWTLPDMNAISDEFDRTGNQDDYEDKVAALVRSAYKRVLRDSNEEYEKWWAAIRLLSKQDHYILVMIRKATLRPRGDQIKLLGTGIAVAGLFICLVFLRIYLEGRYGLDFGRYIPSRDTREFLWWTTLVSLVALYFLLRCFLGERRVDDFLAKSLAGLGRIFNRTK